MNDDTQLGEIPVEDYLKIAGKRRSVWWRRGGLLAVLLGAGVTFAAVGDYYNPFYGNPRTMSYEEAIDILRSHPQKQWVAETGMYAATHHAAEAMKALRDLALESPRDARYASSYLRNLGSGLVEHLIELRDAGVLPDIQRKSLQKLHTETQRDDD